MCIVPTLVPLYSCTLAIEEFCKIANISILLFSVSKTPLKRISPASVKPSNLSSTSTTSNTSLEKQEVKEDQVDQLSQDQDDLSEKSEKVVND